jgi:hypothetical protein
VARANCPSPRSRQRSSSAAISLTPPSLSRASGCLLELVCEGLDASEQLGEPGHRLALDLAHTLPRDAELLADRFQRLRSVVEAEAKLEHAPFPLGELRQGTPHLQPAQRVDGLVLRIRGERIAEEVAELALVLDADALVQRDRCLGRVEGLVDVLGRELRSLGQLLAGRLATELRPQPPADASEL